MDGQKDRQTLLYRRVDTSKKQYTTVLVTVSSISFLISISTFVVTPVSLSPLVARVVQARIARDSCFAVLILLHVGSEANLAAFVSICWLRNSVAAPSVAHQLAHQLVAGFHG